MKKITPEQMRMVLFAVLIVFLYWLLILSPLLGSNSKTSREISKIKDEISKLPPVVPQSSVPKRQIVLFPRGEQLSKIVGFIDEKFKKLKINLTTMKQASEDNRLTIDMNFETDVTGLLKFLNSLAELNTFLLIDNISIYQKGPITFVKMRLLSGYL